MKYPSISSLKPRSTYSLLKLFDFIPQKLSIQFVWADNPEDTNCISTWLSICKVCKACSNIQLLTNTLYSTKAMEEYEDTCNVIWYHKPLWHHKVMWLLDVTTSALLKQALLGISRRKLLICFTYPPLKPQCCKWERWCTRKLVSPLMYWFICRWV